LFNFVSVISNEDLDKEGITEKKFKIDLHTGFGKKPCKSLLVKVFLFRVFVFPKDFTGNREAMQKQYSIPQGLPTIICQEGLIKPIAYYYQLKSLYKGGIILNWKYRKQEIADLLKISRATLYNNTNKLIELGLAKKEGKHLVFTSEKFLLQKFGIKYRWERKNRTVYYVYRHDPLNIGENCEEQIKGLMIKESLEKQEFIVKNKIIKNEIAKSGSTTESNIKKLRKVILKRMDTHLKYNRLRGLKSIVNEKNPEINPIITLSRGTIARKLNRKSKSTGYRAVKKLKNLGIVSDSRQRLLKFQNVSREFYYNLVRVGLNENKYYQFIDGNVYLILPNLINYIKNNSTANPELLSVVVSTVF
jgi:predicted transcriptional regulator